MVGIERCATGLLHACCCRPPCRPLRRRLQWAGRWGLSDGAGVRTCDAQHPGWPEFKHSRLLPVAQVPGCSAPALACMQATVSAPIRLGGAAPYLISSSTLPRYQRALTSARCLPLMCPCAPPISLSGVLFPSALPHAPSCAAAPAAKGVISAQAHPTALQLHLQSDALSSRSVPFPRSLEIVGPTLQVHCRRWRSPPWPPLSTSSPHDPQHGCCRACPCGCSGNGNSLMASAQCAVSCGRACTLARPAGGRYCPDPAAPRPLVPPLISSSRAHDPWSLARPRRPARPASGPAAPRCGCWRSCCCSRRLPQVRQLWARFARLPWP